MQNSVLYVMDCANVGWAASYAHSYMINNKMPTGVIFGFFKTILNCTEVMFPNTIAFAWESLKSRRKLLYPQYKEKTELDMAEERIIQKQNTEHQLDLLRYDILPRIGLNNQLYHTGYEADDVIASVVKQYDFEMSMIISNDGDMYQCITDKVVIFNHSNHSVTGLEEFVNTYGIHPDKWAKVKAMAGCTSDKVPGIDGIGEKKAIQYILGTLSRNTKTYAAIVKGLNSSEYQRDVKLVTLPFNMLTFNLEKDKLNLKELIDVFKEYGLYKLLRASELNRWKILARTLGN